MRCPACGARNADSAAWCSQCYRSLRTGPGPEVSAAPAEVAEPDAAPGPGSGRPQGTAPSDGSSDRRFRKSDEGVDWRCASCESWNPIERSTCTVCGTSLAATMGEADEEPGSDATSSTIALASVLLPGAGHVLLGRVAAGAGRMVLYVVWMVGGIALLLAASGSDGSVLPSLPLLTGALILLATSVLDALALRQGRATELLSVRSLLWLTVGVIGLTTLALIGSALSVSG